MNVDEIKSSLKQMKGSLKEKWGKLTDDEIIESEGRTEYFIGKVQEHYGKSEELATSEVKDFFKSLKDKSK